jgi:isocitrate lyase
MAERITKYHLIGLEEFQGIWANNFEIQNLYAKDIMFAYSLPTSTSTWHSDHRNRPGGYMSGELKLENIKYRKAPT